LRARDSWANLVNRTAAAELCGVHRAGFELVRQHSAKYAISAW
jgi:hypothetical protein